MTVRLPSFSKMKLPNLRLLADSAGLVLVSGSPRRRSILAEAGIPFEIVVPEIEEKFDPDLIPLRQTMELARQKVESVAMDGARAYLGCDTIVVLDGEILPKPNDAINAKYILRRLAGNIHSVFTGLALYDSKSRLCHFGYEESRVGFHHLDDETLERYIATGEPLDKAGAYGIQGMGRILVDNIEGRVDNIVGLPMNALERLAGQFIEKYA